MNLSLSSFVRRESVWANSRLASGVWWVVVRCSSVESGGARASVWVWECGEVGSYIILPPDNAPRVWLYLFCQSAYAQKIHSLLPPLKLFLGQIRSGNIHHSSYFIDTLRATQNLYADLKLEYITFINERNRRSYRTVRITQRANRRAFEVCFVLSFEKVRCRYA